eukprot:2046418-Prymnesium_polylepis.1
MMRCTTALSSFVRSASRTSESTCFGLGHSTIAITPPVAVLRAPTTLLVLHRSLCPAHSPASTLL